MQKSTAQIKKFLSDESGPTATEYAVMLAVISGGALTALAGFGNGVQAIYLIIKGALDANF